MCENLKTIVIVVFEIKRLSRKSFRDNSTMKMKFYYKTFENICLRIQNYALKLEDTKIKNKNSLPLLIS